MTDKKPAAARPELRIRLEAGNDLFARLKAAADERLVSPQLLATRAIETFLADLIPIAQIAMTHTERRHQGSKETP